MKVRLVWLTALMALPSCGESERAAPPAMNPEGAVTANEDPAGQLWVQEDKVERRTYPSDKAPSVGRLLFREAATPMETKGGWTRITRYYEAYCDGGMNRYVKAGDKACTPANGYRSDGTFAEWVRSDQLAVKRPADPATDAKDDERLVAQSDDFRRYHREFAVAARKLIAQGRCTEAEFVEQGGFVKSAIEHRDEPVYFAYCGGMTLANKLYLNVKTGRVF